MTHNETPTITKNQSKAFDDMIRKTELFPQHALKPISMVLIGRHSKQNKRR